MNKWIKRILILLAVIIGIIFFGSIVFFLMGYIFDFMSTLASWFATASRWLAKVVDIFGWTGIFTANADASVIETASMILKGGLHG